MRARALEQQRGEAQRPPSGVARSMRTRGSRLGSGAALVPPPVWGKTHNSGGRVLRRALPQEREIIKLYAVNTARDRLRK